MTSPFFVAVETGASVSGARNGGSLPAHPAVLDEPPRVARAGLG
ncbi:MAG: hypothetical protein ACXV5Q_17280 [Frankiaceae bacterium]